MLLAVTAAAEDDVLAAVERFGQAYRSADVDVLKEMLTADYVHTNSASAPIGRDAWLSWVASRRTAIEEGRLRVVDYVNSDLDVVRHGEMAIVTGRNRTVSEEDGERRVSTLRFTMVWVKAEAGWKRAAFQDCRD